MKIKKRMALPESKSVSYYGENFIVPVETSHIATDASGMAWAYSSKPNYKDMVEAWFGRVVCELAEFDMQGVNPESTCVEV